MSKRTPGEWRQGEGGLIESDDSVLAEVWDCPEREANLALIVCAPELYSLLDQINEAFYCRTTRKEWLALMEKTKPLLRKAAGKSIRALKRGEG